MACKSPCRFDDVDPDHDGSDSDLGDGDDGDDDDEGCWITVDGDDGESFPSRLKLKRMIPAQESRRSRSS